MVGLENDPPIIPVGVILHTRVGLGDSLFGYFDGPSSGVESHMYLTFDGKWEQYRDTTREADANLHGNSFVIDGKRYGFLSVETEGFATDDWSDVQLAEIKEFIAWASREHGFPLRVCPAWNKAGVGYHTMWGAPGPWTPVAKDCPGAKRINQFNMVIVPWLKNPKQEDDMPLTSEDARTVWFTEFGGSNPLNDVRHARDAAQAANDRSLRALAEVQRVGARQVALEAAIAALAKGEGADPAVIKQAVQEALDEYSLTLSKQAK